MVVGVGPSSYSSNSALREYIREKIRSERAFHAYEALAPAYDAFTVHDDHEAWVAELMPHLERHGLAGRRLLDVGCGTGKSFIPMLAREWKVTGYDISPAMLGLAEEKVDDSVRLHVADMRKQPRFGYFDVVWAVNDTLNYMVDRWMLREALRGMRRNLAIGGLVVFDLNTLLTLRTFFGSSFVVETNGPNLIWEGCARTDLPPGSECYALFEIEGRGTNYGMSHRQRHFPEAAALGCISEVGLECLEVFGEDENGVLVQPLDEGRHRKAIYIARDQESVWGRFGEENGHG